MPWIQKVTLKGEDGTGGGTTNHTALTNIGTNTHPQIDTHLASIGNPHTVTKAQVGLGSVDNTSDAGKPVSTAQQTALDAKVAKAGDAMTGLLTLGAGDVIVNYTSNGAQAGHIARVREGTAVSPLTTFGPTMKIDRTMAISRATVLANGGGDGSDGAPAFSSFAKGGVGNELQPIAVHGVAINTQSNVVFGGGNDACAIYGIGRVSGSGTGIGGFFLGRRDNDAGRANAIEVHAANYGTADTAVSLIGFQDSQGIWINAGGNADSSAAITVSNAFGRQFGVGLLFTSQVAGGKTGGSRDQTIRDEGNATTSILINGTHDYGLDLGGVFNIAAIRAKGPIHIVRSTASASNPGSNIGALYLRDGTTTGTLRLAQRAGASGDETTLIDDIPQTVGGLPSTPLSFNPITTTYEYDDFVSGSTSTGTVGKLGWNSAGTVSLVTAETGRPGIKRIATTATSGNVAYIRIQGSSAAPLHTAEMFDITWMVRLTQADAFTSVRIGLQDAFANPGANGMYFERLAADTNWFSATRSASVETRKDTGVAAAAATWIRFRLRRITSTTVGFTVGNGTEVTHGAGENVPNSVQTNHALQVVTGEAVVKSIDVDWFSCRITGLAR